MQNDLERRTDLQFFGGGLRNVHDRVTLLRPGNGYHHLPGGDNLPHLGGCCGDDPVELGVKLGIAELFLRLVEIGLRPRRRGDSALQPLLGLLERGGGAGAGFGQRKLPLLDALGISQLRLRIREIRLRALHRKLER